MAEDPSLPTPTYSSPNADFRREVLANRKLILASNRGPVDYATNESGDLEPRRAAGGVVSALAALSRNTAVTWLSAAMSDDDRLAASRPDLPRPHFLPPSLDHKFVAVPKEVLHRHYNVFSNPILWFIHHYLWNAAYGPQIDARAHEAYKDGYVVVNRAIAEALAPLAARSRGGPTPFTLLQDYQLYLVPGFLRERCPEAILSHFIHTPWPAPNYWLLIPHYMRHAIVESLCQADVLGFQTQEFARNFLNTCEDFLEGANIDYHNRIVRYRGHSVRINVYPISVDINELKRVAFSPECERYVTKLRPVCEQQTIVRVDRLELSKNIVRGFEAYCSLLERRPDLIGQVKFLAFLVPSRSEIPEYQRYQDRVFRLVDEVNKRFGKPGWKPIEVYYENNLLQAIAGMRLADVYLANSVLDGMNLVSKESVIVSEKNAVLILSEATGAHYQLGRHALTVSPGDVEETSNALERALEMPMIERLAQSRALRRSVESEDLDWWVDEQLHDLRQVAQEQEQAARRASVLA